MPGEVSVAINSPNIGLDKRLVLAMAPLPQIVQEKPFSKSQARMDDGMERNAKKRRIHF